MARILFIEDNPTWQTFLKDLLDTAGHETKNATSFDMALNYLNSKERFDVIVFDLHLGTKKTGDNPFVWLDALRDGLVARKIQAPPIIIVTGLSVTTAQVRYCFTEFRGFVLDFFEKSEFNPGEFLKSVKLNLTLQEKKKNPRNFGKLIAYSLLMAAIVILIIGVLIWSVNRIADPKTQQIFLQTGGALIIAFAIFILIFSQGTKVEDVIDKITKIWRD